MASSSNDTASGTLMNFQMPPTEDFFGRFNERDLRRYVSSIPYDVESQRVFVELTKGLLSLEDSRIQASGTASETELDFTQSRIGALSTQFQDTYPSLRQAFAKWKPCRETLVKLSEAGAKNVNRNSRWLSWTRLVCSSGDLVGSLADIVLGEGGSSWAETAFNISWSFGFLGLCFTMLELKLSQTIHLGVLKAIKKDQTNFLPIKDWLEQTPELEAAVREFFPYGIDRTLVTQIERNMGQLDHQEKIFLTAFVSNLRQDIALFRDDALLQKAFYFCRSKAAEIWWNKVILENHATYLQRIRTFLDHDIRDFRWFYENANSLDKWLELRCILVKPWHRLKIGLTLLNLMAAFDNLMDEAPSEAEEALAEMAGNTEAELEAISSIVQQLRPAPEINVKRRTM